MIQMNDATKISLVVIIALFIAACSKDSPPCKGLASAEAVAASVPVIDAFREHLENTPNVPDSVKYLADYRHYDLAITSTDSFFEYEFLPRGESNLKGGGAFYRVSRDTGKIYDVEYMK